MINYFMQPKILSGFKGMRQFSELWRRKKEWYILKKKKYFCFCISQLFTCFKCNKKHLNLKFKCKKSLNFEIIFISFGIKMKISWFLIGVAWAPWALPFPTRLISLQEVHAKIPKITLHFLYHIEGRTLCTYW
jgi:hypothetical protein